MSNTFNNLGKLITDTLVINTLGTGTSINNIGIDSNGNIVSATTITDGSTLIGDGSITNPLTVLTNGSSGGNILISGGAIYSDSGLTFNVSALVYLVAGVQYSTTATTVTLSNGDPGNPRFDAIVADDTNTVSIVQGTPAATPNTPSIGPDQVLVQYILVGAAATTPNITTEYVYRTGSSPDWTTSVLGGSNSANFSSTTPTPQFSNQCILANLGTYGYQNGVRFSTGTPISRSDYVQLSFWVNLQEDLTAAGIQRLYVFAYGDNTPASTDYCGYRRYESQIDLSLVGQWQLVSIPTAYFTANQTTVSTFGFLNFTVWPNPSTPVQIAFDNFRFTTGYGPNLNVATIDLLENGSSIGDTARLNFIDGKSTTVVLTDDNVNNKIDVQVDLSFTGNTSGDCITDLYITNLYGCSPITVHDNIQSVTSSATGTTSFAFGFDTKAHGDYSHAEGYGGKGGAIASGTASHSEGFGTIASGQGSHSEGSFTTASATSSHAEGAYTTAIGASSHAGGANSIASGINSFIHSTNSLVTGDRSVVLGGQNITGSTNDMVYIPNLNIVNIISANDDSDAGLSGLTTGDVYQTSGLGASPLNVAGILMIKQ